MTTPVLTEDGKRLAEALMKVDIIYQYTDGRFYRVDEDLDGDLTDKVAVAAASLRLPLEGDASLRGALVKADLQLGDGHVEAARRTLHAAMDAALARQQPEAHGPVAAGVEGAQIAQALKAADWSSVSIGNKALISAAIGALASTTPPAEAKTPDAGVGEQPDRMTNADELRVAAYYHRDKLPAGLADELLRLADEWSEEVDTLRSALTPTGSAGEDDTGVREAALSQNWLAEEFASAEAEVAQWPPGLRASFGATHGAPQPPKAETPAGVGEIAKAVLRGQGYGPSSIEVFRASDTPVWRKAIRSAAEVAALSTAPAARPGDEVEIWRPVSEADREELVVLGWWQFSTLGFRPRWNAEVGRACDVGSATHFCPLPATPDLASAPAADGGRA